MEPDLTDYVDDVFEQSRLRLSAVADRLERMDENERRELYSAIKRTFRTFRLGEHNFEDLITVLRTSPDPVRDVEVIREIDGFRLLLVEEEAQGEWSV